MTRLLRDEDPYSVLTALCQMLQERLAGSSIAVIDRVSMPRSWEVRASAGMSLEQLALLQDPSARPHLTRLGWRSLQRGPLRITDASSSKLMDAGGLILPAGQGIWVQPIHTQDWVVCGALALTCPLARKLDAVETELLIAGADIASIALERLHAKAPFNPGGEDAVLDGVTAMLLIVDSEGRIVQVNRAFERVFGRESGELFGTPIRQLFVDDPAPLDNWLDAVIAGTRSLKFEGRWHAADNQERWVSWVASGLRDRQGRLRHVVCTGADITDRRRAEREQDQMLQSLLHLQKMEAVEVLVDGFIHDFNNHLTAITGFADLAQSSLPPEHPAKRPLDEVLHSTKLATSLTGSLVSFTRSTVVNRRVCDLVEILEGAESLLRHALPRRIAIEIRTGDGSPLMINADQSQIHQALVALAINSRDAMPRGGQLTIEARFDPDLILPGGVTGAVTVEVHDNGEGIPPEHLARIFQPFFSTRKEGRGSGLGLPSVHRIVREHGGDIQLDSTVGQGTCVRMSLPAASELPVRSDSAGPLCGRVIVADREGLPRSVVVSALRQAGLEVAQSKSLPESLSTGLTEEPGTAAIILDAKSLPGKLESHLAELWGRSPAIRVVVLGSDDAVRDLSDDRLEILDRPFGTEDLLAILRRPPQQEAPAGP